MSSNNSKFIPVETIVHGDMKIMKSQHKIILRAIEKYLGYLESVGR